MAGQARDGTAQADAIQSISKFSAGAALMLGLLDVAGAAAVTAAQRIDGGAAFLGDVAIATTKASEHGINVTGRQAEVRVTGGAIRTSGNQAQGVRVGTENAQDNTALGASVSLQNLIIETAGTGALGVSVHEPQEAAVHACPCPGRRCARAAMTVSPCSFQGLPAPRCMAWRWRRPASRRPRWCCGKAHS